MNGELNPSIPVWSTSARKLFIFQNFSRVLDTARLKFSARILSQAILLWISCASVHALSIKYSEDLTFQFAPRSDVVSASAARTMVGVVERVMEYCRSVQNIEVIILVGATAQALPSSVESRRNANLGLLLVQLGVPKHLIYGTTRDLGKLRPHFRRQTVPNSVAMQLVCAPG